MYVLYFVLILKFYHTYHIETHGIHTHTTDTRASCLYGRRDTFARIHVRDRISGAGGELVLNNSGCYTGSKRSSRGCPDHTLMPLIP